MKRRKREDEKGDGSKLDKIYATNQIELKESS